MKHWYIWELLWCVSSSECFQWCLYVNNRWPTYTSEEKKSLWREWFHSNYMRKQQFEQERLSLVCLVDLSPYVYLSMFVEDDSTLFPILSGDEGIHINLWDLKQSLWYSLGCGSALASIMRSRREMMRCLALSSISPRAPISVFDDCLCCILLGWEPMACMMVWSHGAAVCRTCYGLRYRQSTLLRPEPQVRHRRSTLHVQYETGRHGAWWTTLSHAYSGQASRDVFYLPLIPAWDDSDGRQPREDQGIDVSSLSIEFDIPLINIRPLSGI